jgi:hypothetical protein
MMMTTMTLRFTPSDASDARAASRTDFSRVFAAVFFVFVFVVVVVDVAHPKMTRAFVRLLTESMNE